MIMICFVNEVSSLDSLLTATSHLELSIIQTEALIQKFLRMAGSKKNRNKKASSSKSAFTPPVETAAVDNDDLLDDLVAQLDAQDLTEKQDASTSAQAVSGGSDEQSKVKKDSRSRFEARKVSAS